MTPQRKHILGLGLAALVFALDQYVKWLMVGPLQLQIVREIYLLPIFQFTWTSNCGVSLGLFCAESDWTRWALIGVTSAIAIGVLVWMLREKALAEIAALAMVLGGALGNITDRAMYGHVIDYADLHFGEFRPFLVFNLADAAITIGVLIILARSFLSREKRDDQAANPASES